VPDIRHRAVRLRQLAAPLFAATMIFGGAAPALAGGSHPTPTIVDTARGHGTVVSYTFDDGPNPVDTPRLLAVLRAHRIRAVFCVQGNHAREYPALVRRIAAEGHLLCNHSLKHDDLGAWPAEQIRADLLATNAAIRAAVPRAHIPYFRAPYGSWGATPTVAASLGMQPLGWRVDIADWDPPPSADELTRRLLDRVTPGAVVLMHDGGGDRSATVEAVARTIPLLKAQGYKFTLPLRTA
jgi:peptidoglycan-N-acetylglucosamine deacetylase